MRCPTCNKAIPDAADNKWRPFCSKRCQLIDLGDWLTEAHRISADEDEPQDVFDNNDENLPH
jgi:endogenous inhibitor of DNA gyrase (YacG/DUF329 family)